MAIRQTITPGGTIRVALDTVDDWLQFVDDNHDEIAATYRTASAAFRHAIQGGLVLGGGAAPRVTVHFVE